MIHHPTNRKGVETSPYGVRGGVFHAGIDWAAGLGSPIYAIADGLVVDLYENCTQAMGYNCPSLAGKARVGNFVAIDHKNGYYSVYYHLSAVEVKKGQKVKRGQVIGKEGSTGYSTGSHLHFEIRTNLAYAQYGGSLDPKPYLDGQKTLPASGSSNNFWLFGSFLGFLLLVVLAYFAYKHRQKIKAKLLKAKKLVGNYLPKVKVVK